MISDMAVDCVCCESLDISYIDLIDLINKQYLLSTVSLTLNDTFYASNLKTFTTYTSQVRAPPIV